MTTSSLDVGRFARNLADFRRARRTAPLTCVRAWHNPDGTSQLRVVQSFATAKTIVISGGNRSGKTTIARWVTIALLLGSDHPHARLFWKHHDVDPDIFPKGPAQGAIVALSHESSVKLHRRATCDLLPAGSWRLINAESKGEAHVHIAVPGYDRPATVWFMAEGQKMEAFQGTSWRIAMHDEEGEDGRVWDEAGVRVLDQDGWHVMANTPLRGRSWLWRKYVQTPIPGVAYLELYTRDNPFLPARVVAELSTTDKARARLYGAWEVATGLVYPQWSRAHHVLTRERWAALYPGIPFGQPPAGWQRYRTKDFGSTNPCVVVWGALDPHGRIVIYRSAYHRGQTMAWWAGLTRRAEGLQADGATDWRGAGADTKAPEAIEQAWADPAGAQEIRDLIGMGVVYAYAQKALSSGLDAVREMLAIQADGWPALLVVDEAAPELVTEIESYAYPEDTGKAVADEKPRKKDDHAMDCLRYLVVGVRRVNASVAVAAA